MSRPTERMRTRALYLHGFLQEWVNEKERKALDRMISEYRSGDLDERKCLSIIAGLSELRLLLSSLDREAKASLEAATEVLNGREGREGSA